MQWKSFGTTRLISANQLKRGSTMGVNNPLKAACIFAMFRQAPLNGVKLKFNFVPP